MELSPMKSVNMSVRPAGYGKCFSFVFFLTGYFREICQPWHILAV